MLTLSLKKRLLGAYNLEKRAPIQWGITHERNAKDDYCKEGSATVLPTGMYKKNNIHQSGILGASPDGLVQGVYSGPVHLQQNGQQLLSLDITDIKCPFSATDMTVAETCCSNKDFFLEPPSHEGLMLKETHDYRNQIQGQLYLTGTNCCDLIVWTPKDMQIIRIVKYDSYS
ncbi:uncharacterized protein LOC127857417 [Dreissena polymorpha]|uniref:uncharacterized protein LOC127857417 n=1 Tax=Dreissena polymorpha TaxID=45954 RepID=UPI00226531D1|nr:uncharacterized protein LOC127857417 [Dreissena polymorpha]